MHSWFTAKDLQKALNPGTNLPSNDSAPFVNITAAITPASNSGKICGYNGTYTTLHTPSLYPSPPLSRPLRRPHTPSLNPHTLSVLTPPPPSVPRPPPPPCTIVPLFPGTYVSTLITFHQPYGASLPLIEVVNYNPTNVTAYSAPVVDGVDRCGARHLLPSPSIPTCIHTYIRTHTYIHTCIHAHIYIHTYIPTQTHTYIHTYIHTYTSPNRS